MQKTNCPFSKCKSAAFVVTLIALFLNLSCSKNTPSSNENIKTFKIGVIATQSFEEQQKMIQQDEEYLQKYDETGVNFQVASDYHSFEDADYNQIRILRAKLNQKTEVVR